MARLVTTIDVPGDPKDVFDYLADFSNTPEWDPNVAEAERLDAGKIGLSSRFRVVVSFFGASGELAYRVTAYERPHRIRLEASNAILGVKDDVAITPVAGGARITWDAELRLPFYLRPLDPLFQTGFRWLSAPAIERLRETLRERARLRPRAPRRRTKLTS